MTRMPDLERELVVAAQRRYGKARRRRPSLGGLRVLVPLAAVVLVAVVALGALRTTDPEVEAPVDRAAPPERVKLDGLVPQAGSDPDVRPVSLAASDRDGARWRVAVYADRETAVCVAAAAEGTEQDRRNGPGCSHAAALAETARTREGVLLSGEATTSRSRLVYGLVAEGAESVQVRAGGAEGHAVLSEDVFTRRVSGYERDQVRVDTRLPKARTMRLRLFAAAFTPRQLPDGVDEASVEVEVDYAAGREPEPGRAAEVEEVACHRETALSTGEVTVLELSGAPVEVCRRMWRKKGLAISEGKLTACAGERGGPLVFPAGPEICARHGLTPYGG